MQIPVDRLTETPSQETADVWAKTVNNKRALPSLFSLYIFPPDEVDIGRYTLEKTFV